MSPALLLLCELFARSDTGLRRSVTDWLRYMHLVPASPLAEIDRYIGYWQPYATSHAALDSDTAMLGGIGAGVALDSD
jgi:hypothetical protein